LVQIERSLAMARSKKLAKEQLCQDLVSLPASLKVGISNACAFCAGFVLNMMRSGTAQTQHGAIWHSVPL
jgi:hypothetical protein